jgi:hypothetical protein
MAGMIRDGKRHYLNVNRNGYSRPAGQFSGRSCDPGRRLRPARAVGDLPDRIAGGVPTSPPAALSLTAMADVTCSSLRIQGRWTVAWQERACVAGLCE